MECSCPEEWRVSGGWVGGGVGLGGGGGGEM